MNKIATAKKFVARHRVAIAVTATTIVLTAVHMRIVDDTNEFLKEHDLFDEFYAMNEED
jgi:hypothetical protein